MKRSREQKQRTVAAIFLVLGTILWLGTLQIRGMNVEPNPFFLFLLGGMPNFGTAWMLPSFFVIFLNVLMRKPVSRIVLHGLLIGTILLQIMSEGYYSFFGTSSFEWVDILFGLVALIVLNDFLNKGKVEAKANGN